MGKIVFTVFVSLIVSGSLFLFEEPAQGRITTKGNGLWAMDATLIVLVKPTEENHFLVEEIFLEENKTKIQIGNTLTLPNFKLFTQQMYGPDLIYPMTENTRILLYLRPITGHNEKSADSWIPTQSGFAFFWAENPAGVQNLRNMAGEALKRRHEWEVACNTIGAEQKIKALWPFIEKYNSAFAFSGLVQKELQKIGTPAGDYLASQIESMSHNARMSFLLDFRLYKSKRLHQKVILHIKKQQKLYDDFYVDALKTHSKSSLNNWNSLPDDAKNISGEIYYGLSGLALAKDRQDLPFIRQVALWATKYHFDQIYEAALQAFRDMPDSANLPVIQVIWHTYSTGPHKNHNELLPSDIARALHTHKFIAIVPLLAQFLQQENEDFEAEAQQFLTQIVGKNLGPKPEPWLQWYRNKQPKPKKK